MVEEMFEERKVFTKENMEICEKNICSEPGDSAFHTIKTRFRPLDNPKRVIALLKVMSIIKRGLVGKNITTGPNQYAFYRQCLTGQALAKFDELTQNAGVETISHLVTVFRGIRGSLMANEPLLAQTSCIRNYMRKPSRASTWQYVYTFCNIKTTSPSFIPTMKLV